MGIKFSKVFCFVFEHISPTSKIHLLVEGAHVDRCWAILSFLKRFIGSAGFSKDLFGTHLGSLVSNSFFATDLPGECLKKLRICFFPGFKKC